jgi:hypothetical protein
MPNINGVNQGKANYYPDAGATIAVFGKGVVEGINPNIQGNYAGVGLALSSAIPLSTFDPSNQTCSLVSLLGLFCQADPDQIPAAFSSFCSALADPNSASPSAPATVTGIQTVLPGTGVDLTFSKPVYGTSGAHPPMNVCASGQCDVITGYDWRVSLDGKTWSNWVGFTGESLVAASQTVNLPLATIAANGTIGAACGIHNKVCLYQVRAQNRLANGAETGFGIAINGQAGTTPNPGVKAQ